MATAKAKVESITAPGVVIDLLRNLSGWSTWMPGVASVKIKSDPSGTKEASVVTWDIAGPGGALPVDLEFSEESDGVSFRSIGPEGTAFTRLDGRASAKPNSSGCDIELEMTMETQPPGPPAAIISQLVEAAVTNIRNRAASVRMQESAVAPDAAVPELVFAPMSDGAEIAVDVYRAGAAPAPAILLVIPYRRDHAIARELAKFHLGLGYNFLAADVRGFGGSKARYEGLLSQREIQDGVELIEWAAAQDFCDGKVATMGASYCGCNQILFASRGPAPLKCITPVVGPVDTYRDWTHRGGIPSHTLWGGMTYLRAQQRATMRDGLEHYYLDLISDPLDNDGHRARSPEYVFEKVETPALCVGGWHDYFLRGTIRTYLGVKGPKRLVIGPWGHAEVTPKLFEELSSWYSAAFEGREFPTQSGSVFTTGAEEWEEIEDWPPPARWMSLHLGEKALVQAPGENVEQRIVPHSGVVPMAMNVKGAFAIDDTDSGMSKWGEDRVFDGEAVDADTVVRGHVVGMFRMKVRGCDDFDLNARLSYVKDDGSAVQLTEGRLRATHRAIEASKSLVNEEGDIVLPWHPHDREEPVPDDQEIELVVEMGALSHMLRPGERLRVGLTLTRSDEGPETASATFLPGSRVSVPLKA